MEMKFQNRTQTTYCSNLSIHCSNHPQKIKLRRIAEMHKPTILLRLLGFFAVFLSLSGILCAGTWHTDAKIAAEEAKKDEKMLLVFFYDDTSSISNDFEQKILADPALNDHLADFTLLRQPLPKEKEQNALYHKEMVGLPGLVIHDYNNKDTEHYGQVVSTFPFLKKKAYNLTEILTILDLPEGTLSQRTIIYAIRIHPDKPQSTNGEFNDYLSQEATSHSEYQAKVRQIGHQNWDSRFRRIISKMPNQHSASEVCAQSWPNENILEAAIGCVYCWRYSAGHWKGVSGKHPYYAYDMKKGSNGIWYATGIFAKKR